MLKLLSIPLAFFAYTLLSIGLVLMKKGISWIGFKGQKNPSFYKNLFIWIAGFILTNSYIVPNTLALKHLDPHIVASVAGWGVVMMILFSRALLKEKLYRSDLLFAAVIFIAILLLNFFEYHEDARAVNWPMLTGAVLLPLALALVAVPGIVKKKIKALLLAVVSGISAGMIVVIMKILVSDFGFRVADYFTSPYFYLYLFFSLSAFITLQIAYKLAVMMIVGPAQYSAAIIYPALCSFFIFSNRLHLIQIIAITTVIASVTLILKKHSRDNNVSV